MIIIIVVATAVVVLGLGIYLIVSLMAKNSSLEKENSQLKQQIEELKKTSKKSSSTSSSTVLPSGVAVPSSTRDAIQNALNSKNNTELTSLFASSVLVAKAGSSATKQSAAQASASLSYLNGATSPWNYNPSSSTLGQYQAGPYGQYFTDNSVVGTSSNGYVVSVGVNSSGQIDTILMSNNTTDVVGSAGSE